MGKKPANFYIPERESILDAIRFTDVTKQTCIDFLYIFGDYTYENILEISGSGVTVFDYDGNGTGEVHPEILQKQIGRAHV